ncbi:AT-rich interactive domain-containing protein 2 [Frankliniella fusca]|uniref:AT-rich interactive domain-containing protein 2 n=1 Tax=Frankliniella fusca TaxID=407009 RepID=A0AAE1HI69_9NEOP|nr:AT-rich interactive domain-containing protein 2 [Frankliniella fusca]
MAQVLNKDPITYQKERDGFLRELQHFHETRGTPFRRVPQINGQEVDLYLLYVLVTAHGGWLKVNYKNEWDDLMDQFKLPQQCVNAGVALKQVYLRYLDRYEKVHFLGEDGGRASDEDDDSRHKRWSARVLHSVPLVYNTHQHILSETQRAYHGLSTDLYKPSDYDRLAMSLMSPLPNEQDFAINVCTLLSNEGKYTLKLDKCPRLVDFLLAHAAVFSNEGTRELFQEVYGKVRHSSMTHFWADVLEDAEMLHLTDEAQWPLKSRPSIVPSFTRTDSSNSIEKSRNSSSREISESEYDLDECGVRLGYPSNVFLGRRKSGESSKTDHEKTKKPRIEIEPSDLELFCLGRTLGTQDYLGQRVVQVSTILRNLSFGEENQSVLATNPTFLRFLLLCLHSRWDTLRQLGLDALGNIASELQLERLSSDALLQLILTAVTQRLFGQDRAGIIAALEILNKLGQREDNEDALQRSLDGKVYEQIIRYLTLHDIMLLVQTLECLYSLSSLGERACNFIVRIHGVVDTLVSLITVEAQSYGPKACILMRVVETISGHENSGHNNHLTVMQNAAPSQVAEYPMAGHSGSVMQHTLNSVKKVYPSPMMTKVTPIRPAFTSTQSGSGSPVVTLHPQLALQHQNPQQQTMFPPSSQHSSFQAIQSVQTSVQSLQPQQQNPSLQASISQPSSQMMSVIAQAPPMSTPASVIQHPPSSQSPQPTVPRQAGTPPPATQVPSGQLTAQEMVVRENEQFATSFLRSTYENVPGCRVEQSEVYNKYLSACAKAGRKGVIAPHHFPKCVRTAFGVTSVPVVKPVTLAGDTTPSGHSKQLFYEGIKVRPKPIPVSVEATESASIGVSPIDKKKLLKPKKLSTTGGTAPITSSSSSDKNAVPVPPTSVPSSSTATSASSTFTPTSSILLSQLSAPPKPKDTPATAENANQVTSHPHLSQALGGSETNPSGSTSAVASTSSNNSVQSATSGAQPTNTSLIKSLLATKVGETSMSSPQPAGMMSGNITSYNIDVGNIQQVAQRQRLQQQQQQQPAQSEQMPGVHLQQPSLNLLKKPCNPNNLKLQALKHRFKHNQMLPSLLNRQLKDYCSSNIKPNEQQPGAILTSTIVNHQGKAVRVARINGARAPTIIQIQPKGDGLEAENHVGGTVLQSRRDPPQPPPPPLAPLSSGPNRIVTQESTDGASVIKCTNNLIVSDEHSTKANNQSVEGVLVNGAAHGEIKTEIKQEEASNEDTSKSVGKGNLMLVDLLDKSVDVKEPPVLNGGLSSKDLLISERGLELVSKGTKTELGKQIRITERGSIEVVDTITGSTDKDLTGMELRLTERGLELVDKQSEVAPPTAVQQDNVLQKELSVGEKLLEFLEKQDANLQDEVMVGPGGDVATCTKRSAEDDPDDKSEVKRLRLEVNGNGSNSGDESSQGEEKVKASSAAANLYSALAASVLEDEDPDLLMEQVPQPQGKEEPAEVVTQPQLVEKPLATPAIQPVQQTQLQTQPQSHPPQQPQSQVQSQPQLQLVQSGGTIRQVFVSSDPNQSAPAQQVMMAGTRQIIVSQALTGQNPVLITAGGQISLQGGTTVTGATAVKTASGQTVLMQTNTGSGVITGTMARPAQYVISQQGQQLQLVQPGGQLQIASGGVGGQQFVMAQPQTALIQGQPQTVLVAQTPQQQGTSAKTIIILQQQPGTSVPVSGVTTQAVQQKIVAVTPQGQPVVVTPVQRPVIQSSAVSHSTPPALIATSQQPSPAPSPAPPTVAPTGIPTPVLTANPSPVQTPSPSPIPTPTITANPNASAGVRPNVVRPSPTPSPNAMISKPNGVVSSTSITNATATRIGTRSSLAKSATVNTVTTASAGPASPQPTATPINSLTAKPTMLAANTPTRVGGMPSPAPRLLPNQSMFLCEWRGCMRSFKSANEVYMHACEAHCPSGSQEIQCLWERCDAMKRKRFSLMTHLFDRHCNADVLRMMAMRRRQLSQSGRSEIPPPQPPPPHPGYAPNAAFHAIKRHALEFVNPKELLHKPGPAPVPVPPEQDDNEGPVTKSIRLTAALILRNLVIYSNSGRRLLRSHEPHLASVALSNVESSRTVAQVLYDMNHASNR